MGLAYDDKSTIFYKKGNILKPLAHKDPNTNKTDIIGLLISEDLDLWITVGSAKDPNIYIMNTKGKLQHKVKTFLEGPHSVAIDKPRLRLAILTVDSSCRIYRVKTDNSGKKKGLDIEFVCGGPEGHTDSIYNGCFNSDGSKFFSVGEDMKLKVWDLTSVP